MHAYDLFCVFHGYNLQCTHNNWILCKEVLAKDASFLPLVPMQNHISRLTNIMNFIFISSVLFKVCRFLCSRSRDIRISARDTLTKIVLSLGPLYFSYVLNEMSSTLKRGYQVTGQNCVFAKLKFINNSTIDSQLKICML